MVYINMIIDIVQIQETGTTQAVIPYFTDGCPQLQIGDDSVVAQVIHKGLVRYDPT